MQIQNQPSDEFFELLNRYPSPQNGQPICLNQVGENRYELCFETDRGLQAAEVSFLFSFVTMGLFVTYMSMCAEALGHRCVIETNLPKLEELKRDGLLPFAIATIDFAVAEPDARLRETLRFRQTSRKKYTGGLNEDLSRSTIDMATQKHMKLVKMDRTGTHQAIWLNQRAVFDDMFDDAVRHELNHWLRYSRAEKEAKMDGLAYDCMELNGRAMKFIVKHYKILRLPGISTLLKKYYLRTMSDNSDAYYLLTPFSNEQEAFEVGVAVMEIWEVIAEHGYYLHPFGTIMSNVAAHNDFLKLAQIEHEDPHKNFLVFIYRAGKSEKPNASMRLPVKEHLLRRQGV
jgi:hypothetical protein